MFINTFIRFNYYNLNKWIINIRNLITLNLINSNLTNNNSIFITNINRLIIIRYYKWELITRFKFWNSWTFISTFLKWIEWLIVIMNNEINIWLIKAVIKWLKSNVFNPNSVLMFKILFNLIFVLFITSVIMSKIIIK
jgi:hypothetical protein